jgi:FkbM family methyltransferase
MWSILLNFALVTFIAWHHEKFIDWESFGFAHNELVGDLTVGVDGNPVSRSLVRMRDQAARHPPQLRIHPVTFSKDGIQVNTRWMIGDNKGHLNIPQYSEEKRYKLIVDVGTEKGSGFIGLNALYPDVVLMLFEGHPVNFGQTVWNMLHNEMIISNPDSLKNKTRLSISKDRVLFIPVALSNTTGYIDFKESFKPGCGSLLSSKEGSWWCTQTKSLIPVAMARLDLFLALVPANYDFYLLKIDVEGADHMVMRGGGSYIRKFQMVFAECRPANATADLGFNVKVPYEREGSCKQVELNADMTSFGFTHQSCNDEDCMYAKSEAGLQQIKKLYKIREFGAPVYNVKTNILDLNYYVTNADLKSLDF